MMKSVRAVVIAAATTLVLWSGVLWAQSNIVSQSPKDVVAKLWAMEMHGGTLSEEGWLNASRSFIRPTALDLSIVHVISSDAGNIDEVARTANWAEVYVGTVELAQFDSALRYRPPQLRADATLIRYDLVLTDAHWELGPDGILGPRVIGPSEWRIVSTAEGGQWITATTAIQYVTKKRDETHDAAVKQNADVTLTKLKELQLRRFER